MPPSSTNIKNPKEVHFFRAGYRDATNYKEGLKPKDRLSFNKDKDSDAETRIQSLLTETRQNEDIKEMNVYVRRRYFPIMPAAYLRKPSPKAEDDEKQNTAQSEEEKEEKDSPKRKDDDDTKKNNSNETTTPNKLGLDEVTKDFDDIMNVVVLDEALPEVHKFQTQVECTNFEEYNLPEGARVVGDRVIIPPRPGLFGGMTEETTVPLSFYKKSTMPTFGAAPGGSSLFGTAQPGESLFGTTNNSIPAPSGGLFGANKDNSSSLFGGTGGGGGLFSGSNTGGGGGGFNFGAAAKSTNNNNDGFLFGSAKKTTAATKPVKAAKPAKVGSTTGLFGAPSTSHQSAFSFKFNEEPEIEF